MNRTQYLLIKLIEEAAEVQEAATKCLRFGLDNYDPKDGEGGLDNLQKLSQELSDFAVAKEALDEEVEYAFFVYPDDLDKKRERLEHFFNISRELGIIT